MPLGWRWSWASSIDFQLCLLQKDISPDKYGFMSLSVIAFCFDLHSIQRPNSFGIGFGFLLIFCFFQSGPKICNMMRVSRPICYQFCVGDPCHRNTHSSPPYSTASSKWRPVLQPVPFQHQPTDEAVLSHIHCDWLWLFHKELSDKTWGARK